MSGPFVKLVRRMISRTIQSVFAPTVGAAIARAWRGGPWIALALLFTRPAAAQAPAVDRVVRSDEVGRFKPPPGVLGASVDSNSVPTSVP
jgi:hypothetical protein